MRGTGIDLEVEIYATKQAHEHQRMELKGELVFCVLYTIIRILQNPDVENIQADLPFLSHSLPLKLMPDLSIPGN
jgi:hypothetical protein